METPGAPGEQDLQAAPALELMAGAVTERCLVTAEGVRSHPRGRAYPLHVSVSGDGPRCLGCTGHHPRPGREEAGLSVRLSRWWVLEGGLGPPLRIHSTLHRVLTGKRWGRGGSGEQERSQEWMVRNSCPGGWRLVACTHLAPPSGWAVLLLNKHNFTKHQLRTRSPCDRGGERPKQDPLEAWLSAGREQAHARNHKMATRPSLPPSMKDGHFFPITA